MRDLKGTGEAAQGLTNPSIAQFTRSSQAPVETFISSSYSHDMDSFENFQYDSASSYGGMGSIVDDTSSIYTGVSASQSRLPADLESLETLSIADSLTPATSGNIHAHLHHQLANPVEEDIEAVLDDLKDEGVNLPPHACR